MWWKTVLVVLGTLAVLVVWSVLVSFLIPGDETGPYLVRMVLSVLFGFSLGRIAWVLWDGWTADDRRW